MQYNELNHSDVSRPFGNIAASSTQHLNVEELPTF